MKAVDVDAFSINFAKVREVWLRITRMTYILEWMEETIDYTKAVMHFQAKAQIRWTKHNIYLIES